MEGLSAAAVPASRSSALASVDAIPSSYLQAGGRVLDVTAVGPTVAVARERAYEAVAALHWPGLQVRSDIAAAV